MSACRSAIRVVVIRGNDKGKRGKVSKLTAERVVVEGVNLVKRHLKQTPQRPGGIPGRRGGYLEVERDAGRSDHQQPTRVSIRYRERQENPRRQER